MDQRAGFPDANGDTKLLNELGYGYKKNACKVSKLFSCLLSSPFVGPSTEIGTLMDQRMHFQVYLIPTEPYRECLNACTLCREWKDTKETWTSCSIPFLNCCFNYRYIDLVEESTDMFRETTPLLLLLSMLQSTVDLHAAGILERLALYYCVHAAACMGLVWAPPTLQALSLLMTYSTFGPFIRVHCHNLECVITLSSDHEEAMIVVNKKLQLKWSLPNKNGKGSLN